MTPGRRKFGAKAMKRVLAMIEQRTRDRLIDAFPVVIGRAGAYSADRPS